MRDVLNLWLCIIKDIPLKLTVVQDFVDWLDYCILWCLHGSVFEAAHFLARHIEKVGGIATDIQVCCSDLRIKVEGWLQAGSC